jgi:TetR/AcrR family transcriptional regulator, regulator of cefoperazone and chloramphenicol sensitivity
MDKPWIDNGKRWIYPGIMKNNQDQKQELIEAVVRLLVSGSKPDELTLRKIAEEAGTAHGLVNYYFGSRDALLVEAVATLMQRNVSDPGMAEGPGTTALARIRSILGRNLELAAGYPELSTILAKADIENSGWGVISIILPELRRHFGSGKSEEELIVLAAQIVIPMQVILIHPGNVHAHLGWSFGKKGDRERFLDLLLLALGRE